MNAKEHFLRMFAYDSWANRESVTAMGRTKDLSAATLGRMAHVLSAEKLWHERLRAETPTMPVWPTTTLSECAALAKKMSAVWQEYLRELPAASFDETVEYRNSRGEKWASRVEDVLTHVLMHSAYHRGQVAFELRAAGAEPAYTDFIHAVRHGFVE